MATWTSTDVANLKAAIASGVLAVEYAGPPSRRITYQSLAEMRSLLASMEQDIARANGGRSYKLISTCKGV